MKNINKICDELKTILEDLNENALKAEADSEDEKVDRIDAAADYVESALLHLDTIRKK